MMKEKKYLYDRFYKSINTRSWLLIILAIFLLSFIISYPILNHMYLKEATTLSENDFTYLTNVATNIYDKDNKTINISNLPDNVRIFNSSFDNNMIKFDCYLDKNFKVASEPHISVTISNDFKNIEIESMTKEDYYNNTKDIIILSLFTGSLSSMLIIFLIFVIDMIIYFISWIYKKYDIKKTNK